MTEAQFATIGEALYGPSWRAALAGALDVAERTVRRWEQGDSPIPDGVPDELAALCRKHSDVLVKLAQQIEGKR